MFRSIMLMGFAAILVGMPACVSREENQAESRPASAAPSSEQAPVESPTPPQSADTLDQVQQDAHDLWSSIRQYTIEQKAKAVSFGQSTMTDIEAEYTQLKDKASAAGEAARARWEAMKIELDAQMSKAQAEFDAMKNASADQWDQSKQKLAQSLEAMGEKLDSAAKSLKGTEPQVPDPAN